MMIKCKKDLINTYIENDRGELRDLYLAKCESLGLVVNPACKTVKSEIIFTKDREWQFGNVDHSGPDICYLIANFGEMKELTLSDLKQCAIETPEESEALNAIVQVDSEEWRNGDACSYYYDEGDEWRDGVYITQDNGFHVVRDLDDDGYTGVTKKNLRKPETPQQREERERLERGEEMYIQHCKNMGADKFYWDEKNAASKEAWCKLAEQYRKQSK